MGFEPTVKTETFGGSDKSWIRMRFGLDSMLPIMLDMSTFSSNHVVNGKIPSGTVLGKITSSGWYGPYGGRTSESVSLAIDATGGTFTLTFQGQTTGAIAFNATAAAVQAELEKLDDVNVNDIFVTGGPGNAGHTTPYILTFNPAGQYDTTNAPDFTATGSSLTGGAGTAVPTITQGGSAVSDGREVAQGHLFEDVEVPHAPGVTPDLSSCADVAATLYWRGVVLEAKLPTFGGTNGGVIDAGGKVALPQIRYV